jgi:regulator of nonsense transcripts 2
MVVLNLSKYIGEVASGLVEAKLKMTDLPGALEISSFLHQRYADFSQHMMENWQKALAVKKEVANPSKMRVDLRFYAEMVAVGIFTLKEGLALLGQVLTRLVSIDKEDHSNVSIMLTFCKHCGEDYAGLLPRKIRVLADMHRYEIPTSSVLPTDKHKNVRQLLKEYYKTVCKHLVEEYRELQNTERTNRRILLTKGEVHEVRKEKAEALQLSYTKLLANTEQLSDVLDEDMPDMAAEDKKDEDDIDEVAELEAQVGSSRNLYFVF